MPSCWPNIEFDLDELLSIEEYRPIRSRAIKHPMEQREKIHSAGHHRLPEDFLTR